MSTTVWSLLAVCAVMCVMHRAPVMSQCTTKHCHDEDSDASALTALVTRLQDIAERQQDSLEQQRTQNLEQRTLLAILNETVDRQDKQLTRLEEILAKQDQTLRNLEILAVHDCTGLLKLGHSTSGVYNISLANKKTEVFCDMSDGDWLVFQRRVDNTTDFYLDWKSYKDGFGDLTRNFWLGNDNLHAITAQKNYSLRVDLADFEGHTRFAEYADFAVANEDNKYRLTVRSYSGTAGDSLGYHDGMAFSTRDRDNDRLSDVSCAQLRKGGWWYNGCQYANLNGLYLGGANTATGEGISWFHWHGYQYSLKTVAMKIRPQ